MLREFKLVSATLTFGKRGTTVASWLFSPNKAKGAQMRDYTQLTSEERYQIEALLKADHNQTEIAAVLKRHKSTISREVGRDRGLRRGYRPKQAQQLTTKPPEFKGEAEDCPAEPGSGSRATARRGLESPPPEQISGAGFGEQQGLRVSHGVGHQYVSSPSFPSVRKNFLGMPR